ncbi:MAG: (2Fe-2S) ferredoxin domain-containing protein [Firmicutes bacterium]|jgi:NADP-reducing hydrogenase subunit HndB|nr:(2Fe-2S) ferredoxin domain-containing protein [Bacillota bacterium]
MKSLDELKKLREKAQETIRLREQTEGTKIIVGMGTCGIAAGAREVMLALVDELQKKNLADVVVTQTGCAGLCEKEPLVEVVRPGQPKITYGYMTPEKARQMITSHIVNGQVIGEYVIAREDTVS